MAELTHRFTFLMTPRAGWGLVMIGAALVVGLLLWRLGPADAPRDKRVVESTPDSQSATAPVAFIPPAPIRPRRTTDETSESDPNSAATIDDTGRIVFLRFVARTVVADASWVCTRVAYGNETKKELRLESGNDGGLSLSIGRWRIRSADGRFMPVQEIAAVERATATVILVQERRDMVFIVTDVQGSPLSDVTGTWRPRRSTDRLNPELSIHEDSDPGVPRIERKSDLEGRVVFEQCPAEAGVAAFIAADFEQEIRYLSGGFHEPIRIAMRRVFGSSRRLTVQSAVDGQPLNGASITHHLGFYVAAAEAKSNEVTLPKWVRTNDNLVIRGPGVFPSVFRLENLKQDVLSVYPQCSVAVLVKGEQSGGTSRIVCSAINPAGLVPLLHGHWEVLIGERTVIPLPQGLALRVTCMDGVGRSADTEVTLTSSVANVDLVLGDLEAGLELRITDDQERPLAMARASVFLEEGREIGVHADERGIIRIPGGERAEWVWVEAPGFARATLLRRGKAPELIKGTLSLLRGFDVPVRLVTRESAPVRGVRVRVRRHRVPDPDAFPRLSATMSGTWEIQAPRYIVGVTDQNGMFTARGIAAGVVDVQVRLPEPLLDEARSSWALYGEDHTSLEVRDDSEQVITCDPPQLVALDVVEATTGLPVEAFTLSDGGAGAQTNIAGNLWQGWVRSAATLAIVVPRIGQASIRAVDCDSHRPTRVLIPPNATGVVDVRGLTDALAAQGVTIDVMKQTPQGLELAATIPLNLAQGSVQRLALPFDGELHVALRSRAPAGPNTPTFDPPSRRWTTGSTLIFTVVPPPSK